MEGNSPAMKNKRKIFNDPVYGFITIPDELLFDVIEHRWFQRLRRITQLGLTPLVYPGALHTRFHHAIGCMHLMTSAVEVLRSKGSDISDEDAQGLFLAILLHDIGHGPFSHALEHSIVRGVEHELISSIFIKRLNEEFDGKLSMALEIFNRTCPRRFMQQLVSGQLDMDRLDYLRRDSFYTGVSEGVASTERIIKMLNVRNDELVVEHKGIYSIEKFIVARRLMYWQVYLHKTVLAAEHLIIKILNRANMLAESGVELFASPPLRIFLENNVTGEQLRTDPAMLENFALLDDHDLFSAFKVWMKNPDFILADLCSRLINRQLFKIEIREKPFAEEYIKGISKIVAEKYKIATEDAKYFVFAGKVENHAYHPDFDRINILFRSGKVLDITECSDQMNVSLLAKTVTKNFLCYPKEFETETSDPDQ